MSKPILYHLPNCGMCKTIEILFKKKNIEYKSCEDVDYMSDIGITHTPTLDVDGVLYTGREIIDWANKQ